MRERLGRSAVGSIYRRLVAGCARTIAAVPLLERPFVALSRRLWSVPAIGRPLRSVAYRLIPELEARGRRYRSLAIQGIVVTADVTGFAFSGLYFGAVPYEPALTAYLVVHLKPGSVFVDIGANSGYFSLLAAGASGPSGRVYAFEPNPTAFAQLVRHVAVNRCGDRTRLFPIALSDRSAEAVPLFVTPAHTGFATLVPDSAHTPEYLGTPIAVSVPARTFDDWRRTEDVAHVDLMKIDVEGFEREVLGGMLETLDAGRIERIVCETTWDSPAHRLLIARGYRPTVLETVGPVDNIAYERIDGR